MVDMASASKKPTKKPLPDLSKRTSKGNAAARARYGKGGLTTAQRHKMILAQFKSKGGTVLWLRRGSEYMKELGRKGGLAKAANRKKTK